MGCTNCKKSILNSQKSSIPSPDCVDNDCSQDVSCEGIATYSDCVIVVPSLDCIDTAAGEENLSDVLEALDTKLCQVKNGTVKVSVSEPDTCPGFLEDKITVGDGLTIETQDLGGGCERLIIREACWEWTSVTSGTGDGKFTNSTKWKNASELGDPFQNVQYSNIKECIVKLRGSAYNNTFAPISSDVIFTLPSGKRPLYTRYFSVNIIKTSTSTILSGFIKITSDGKVTLVVDGNVTGSYIVSLDGISFEIN